MKEAVHAFELGARALTSATRALIFCGCLCILVAFMGIGFGTFALRMNTKLYMDQVAFNKDMLRAIKKHDELIQPERDRLKRLYDNEANRRRNDKSWQYSQ